MEMRRKESNQKEKITKTGKMGLTFPPVDDILSKLSGTSDVKPRHRASRKNLKKCVDKAKNLW